MDQQSPASGQVVAAIESDVGLTLAVLRRANRDAPARVGAIPQAVTTLDRPELQSIARTVETFALFAGSRSSAISRERIGLHALQTRQAAVRVAASVRCGCQDELQAAALLHDVGKVVLADLGPDHPDALQTSTSTPRERLASERRKFGTDHAALGALALAEFGLPELLTEAVAHHHDPSARGLAAVIRLADMLAHYQQGEPVEPGQIFSAGLVLGLARDALGEMIYSLTYPLPGPATQAAPCPLSARELEVVRKLSSGKVYKQIALELGVSVSTVRNHLHHTYAKLDTVDRAQAVLLAAQSGWL